MAEIATGCAANLLSEGLVWLLKKVVAPVKVLICLPGAVTQMEKDVGDLDNKMHDIKTELDQAQQIANRTVQAWLDDAEAQKKRSDSIGAEHKTYQQHTNCIGCCPKFLRRYKISKDVRECNRNVSDLLLKRAQHDFPSSGQYGDPTPRTQIPITQTGIVPDAMRSKQTDDIERWLTEENSNVQRIGISGMGGVGKTSLLDAINNSQRVKSSFQLIIKVIVSRNDISFLQNNVAERLNLHLPENYSVEKRAYTLRNYLKNKKYVILLDDMWLADGWTLDRLKELGVSFDDTGYKFVLTTRDEEVFARMNVEKTIKVEPLSKEKGWELFRSKAFVNQIGNVPYDIIEPVARRIAEECQGLPLAITVVGAAMAHHTEPRQWQTALEQMRNVPGTFDGLYPTVDKQLFQRLSWSYNVLSEDLQICFLSLAAYPEDAEINCEELIDMWIAEKVVSMTDSEKGSRDIYLHDIGHSYVDHLRNRCLIEVVSMTDSDGTIDEYVKIHDILRDLAVRIAEKKEPSYYFKAGQGMINFPLEEDVSKGKGCAKLSLMYNNLQSLPTTFPCQSLSVLLLRGNSSIKEVPESFLNELPSLRVLDLSYTRITSLPDSIGDLKHLASLQLQCSKICKLPEAIGDLKELQFLNLRGCLELRCLPKTISELTRLRALDITDCMMLNHLPPGISKLVSLERMMMLQSCITWIKDLQTLTRLRAVQLRMPVSEAFMGKWSKMRSLLLSFQRHLPQDMQGMRDLESFILLGGYIEKLPSWFSQFRQLQFLLLSSCDQLMELPTDLPNLRKLHIWHCNNLECVGPVGTVGEGASPLLPMLKTLHVVECAKLKRLGGRWDLLIHLEEIRCDREWWDAIQCDDPNIKTLLQNKCLFD